MFKADTPVIEGSFILFKSLQEGLYARWSVGRSIGSSIMIMLLSILMMGPWGVPDRGVTIAILTLGMGRVPNH